MLMLYGDIAAALADEDSRKILSKVLNFIEYYFKMNLNDNKSGFIVCSKPIFESILNHRFNYNYLIIDYGCGSF